MSLGCANSIAHGLYGFLVFQSSAERPFMNPKLTRNDPFSSNLPLLITPLLGFLLFHVDLVHSNLDLAEITC